MNVYLSHQPYPIDSNQYQLPIVVVCSVYRYVFVYFSRRLPAHSPIGFFMFEEYLFFINNRAGLSCSRLFLFQIK